MRVAEYLLPRHTNRGFKWLPPIAGNYGGEASVYESSSADEPKLWLKITEPDDLNDPDNSPTHEAKLHLTADDAWRLSEQLRWMVENHYHGDARPDGSA